MSPTIGLLTLVAIVIIQVIEGNFIQALIMSKTTKLHPVTIIIGLLVFGHYWGIIGMVLSTPIIASLKIVFNFIDKKWKILNYADEGEEI
jgi:predicted PurR-regulated permease PerM